MLCDLDVVVFPDRCEVIEIIPSQRYVYAIFKNGKSSLYHHAIQNSCKIYINEQIKKLDSIDVILRAPKQRFMSGLNTFIQMTMRDNPELDQNTVTWFACNYLFLNRHYAPQFSWLLNLARYTSTDTTFNFIGMDQLDTLIAFNDKPIGILPISSQLAEHLNTLTNYSMYERLDNVLMECIGNKMTFAQVINHIKTQDQAAYDHVIGRSQRILDPIYVLPKT